LQADAIGEHLSSQILGGQPSFLFEPVSMCVMEQFDKATFAQVPLQYSDGGVQVLTDSPLYKTGTSPMWRLGKGLLGLYLPWRFNAGEPFHAGLPWKGMEAGLKVMAGTMAS
jgi:sulfide:quinone oxidoreductase